MRIIRFVNAVLGNITVTRVVIIALAYFITGRLGLQFAIISSNITLIWLPTGIAVAALFRWGCRYWIAVWLAAFAVNLAIGSTFLIAFGISIGNTLAPLLAVALLRRWHFNANILRWRDVPVFVGSGIIGMMVSAVGGVAVLVLGGVIPSSEANWASLIWWLGDAVGVIVGGTALITFSRDELTRLLHSNVRQEFLILTAAVIAVGLAWVFIPNNPMCYVFLLPLIILVLVWIALRLGVCFSAIAVLVLSIFTAWAFAIGSGPFLEPDLHLALAKLWGYIATMSIVTMLVSSLSAERTRMEQKLYHSEAFVNSILDSLTWHIAVLNPQGEIIAVNNAWRQFAQDNDGCDMLGANYLDAINQVDSDETKSIQDGIQAVLAGNRDNFYVEYSCHSPTQQRWFHMSVNRLIGNRHGVVISHENITDRKQEEIQLRIAATIFESHEGMLITDANNIILKVNQSFTLITGYSALEVIGQTPRILKSGRQDNAFYVALWQDILNTGTWQGEIWNRRKNGEIYPEWQSITAVKDNNGVLMHYISMFVDITERKISEQTINQLAFYDLLTQLPNRRLLYERLKHAVDVSHQTGNKIALLMLDLDRFKAVNDSFGHVAGDQLLQCVAKRIKDCLRDVDMLARLGADEFMILLEDIEHDETVARIAEAIIHNLSRPFTLYKTHNVTIGISIGIVLYPQHGNSAEALIDNVDIALYHAKAQGRGCFAYFSDELTQKARERLALESRLRHAIKEQQFQVYFQPQIDINSGQIIGAEALVRWNDPIHGFITPIQFIPLAEETGLIVALGEWVLRETCRLGRQWLNEGLPAITLAVNVSPYQFSGSDINALVAEILHDTGFPAKYLELEITESGLMDNQQQAMAILNSLHNQGVRLAIDDFGTGYSSLAYLKFFPLDVLKIDKTFIDDIPFLQSDMVITTTIIAMGHHLGFKVLAEGVETQAQLTFLLEQGCNSYQGYFFSKPVPANEFVKLLLNFKGLQT